MSDPDRTIDFRGFATAAAAAAKPDFTDVLTRSTRYRRRRNRFGLMFVAIVVALGSGTAVALTADHSAKPTPTPTPTVGAWHTTPPLDGAGPKPQPSYIEVQPGSYDVAERDKTLTGLYPEMMAGDIDHLYLEYQNCAVKPCRRMLAVTADRGRTWNKLPLPVDPELGQTGLRTVDHTLVLAAVMKKRVPGKNSILERFPDPVYWVSLDAGTTWRRPETKTVDALPTGWLVTEESNGLAAVDPATGDVARLKRTGDISTMTVRTPTGAGIWKLTYAADGVAAQVSQDGGRTWATRPLPGLVNPDGSVGMDRKTLLTSDGRTFYVTKMDKGVLHLHVSADAGLTWQPRPDLALDGPLLSLLPIDDQTVLVEGLHGTYRSTDQARTFTRVGPSLGGRGHAIPGGFTIPTNNNEYSAWVSPDGAEWTYVKRPRVP
ncbi:sialidase family protein [Actinoplanes regularis]|uniref:BNR repeat-like domain-containing protein n=1 Tax=Actinoplanes regularis TaxID=52697 RepID=A0A238USK3_9ACTN|nr:sialidase family protein [Actinoplanes regularis]GIE84485.1 hypothetical protein Are01nite_09650 [Actinoplanes regularis]SNR24911.1 hypothetical protein SAMN06264365_10193 [Actinoplanes regularis]